MTKNSCYHMSKYTYYLSDGVECVLSTIATNYGLSKSKLLEFLILNAGYNIYGRDGLYDAWFLHYDPRDVSFYYNSDCSSNLSDVILSSDDLENAYLEVARLRSDFNSDPVE